MNDQRSLEEQLDSLQVLAVRNGLYDAHDWLLQVRMAHRKNAAHVKLKTRKADQ